MIHYFADNQSQGYDGLAFQEAYKTQVLAKVQEIQDAKKDEKSEDADVDVKDEDLQTFVSMPLTPAQDRAVKCMEQEWSLILYGYLGYVADLIDGP